MNKKDLKMRPVGNEYLEQYNALLRYVFQVTDQEDVLKSCRLCRTAVFHR